MLGTTQRDIITGFQGVATGITHYISGCSQVLLQPKVDANGAKVDGEWFDLQRLERVGDETLVLDNSATPGFDMPAPVR